jgi:drug/metabolite transporter (DMT)-like permease
VTAARAAASRTSVGGIGLTLAIVTAATFGTSGVFASSLIDAGWSPGAAVLARITLAAVLMTIPALIQLRGQWHLLRRGVGRAAAFGLFAVAGAQLCYFNAIERMPVGVALLLEYLGIVLVVGWLWLRHGQRPGRVTIGGGITALAGLVLVLNLTGSTSVNPLGVMWGLLAAVGLATFYVLSAAGGEEALPPVVMTWVAMGMAAAALATLALLRVLPLAWKTTDVTLAGHRVNWILPVVGLAVVAAAIPYVTGIGAARMLGAQLASFVGLVEVLFAIMFAWLLLGQLPSDLQFAGGALILAGVTLVRLDEMRGGQGGRPPRQALRRDLGNRWERLAWTEDGAEEIAMLGDPAEHRPDRETVRR